MAFYDQDKYIRGMGRTRENMANIIQNGARAKINANNAYGRVVSGLSNDASTIATNMIKAKIEEEKEQAKRNALLNALRQGGASKEIIDATANLSSSDILPMVALIANPKNIVTTHHSGGEARVQNTFTGKTDNIGKPYINAKSSGNAGSGNSTYLPLDDPRASIIEKNPLLKNNLLESGTISYDADGRIKTNDYNALNQIVAGYYKNLGDKQLNDQKEQISQENQNLNSRIQSNLNNADDPAKIILKNETQFNDEMKKKYPLIFGK